MFLKTCKGRKSCLDPIPNIFMIFKNLQQRFFSSSSSTFFIFHKMKFSPGTIPRFLQIFIDSSSSTFFHFYNRQWIKKSDVFSSTSKNPKTPKTDHPKKVDFGPFRPSLYRPIRTGFRDGAKMVIFEGSRPQNRKKALFCKKTWSGGESERVWRFDLLRNNHLFPHSCVRSPASFEAQSVISTIKPKKQRTKNLKYIFCPLFLGKLCRGWKSYDSGEAGIISTPKIAQTHFFRATCGGHSLTFCLLKFRRPLRQASKTAHFGG